MPEAANQAESADDFRFVGDDKLAPFNPTDISAQKLAFEALKLSPSDVLYDLGCGDGRFLIHASSNLSSSSPSSPSSLRCIGVEYDKVYADRAALATENNESITILHANVLDVEMDDATAVFVYLVPDGLKMCKDKLFDVLRRGGRVASYMFSIPELNPVETFSSKGGCKVRLYDSSCVASGVG